MHEDIVLKLNILLILLISLSVSFSHFQSCQHFIRPSLQVLEIKGEECFEEEERGKGWGKGGYSPTLYLVYFEQKNQNSPIWGTKKMY